MSHPITARSPRWSIAFAVASALLIAAGAQAQTANNEQTTAAPAAATRSTDELEQVVVTGSRIRRANFDTLEPALQVDVDYLDERGITNVGDVFNDIPGFGISVSPEGAQATFGVGVNFANLFGLGTNRTLTVVNGRRFVSSNTASFFGAAAPGLQVDLNVFPTKLVDRIETLTIGGAPTYGSDAISGTINVILKRDFEGLATSGSISSTEQGDAEDYRLSLIGGRNFFDGRANLTFSIEGNDRKGLLGTERDRIARGLTYQSNPTLAQVGAGRTTANDGRVDPNVPFQTNSPVADGIPGSVLIANGRIFSTSEGGVLLPATGSAFFGNPMLATDPSANTLRGFGPNGRTNLQFAPDGTLVPYDPGIPFGQTWASGGDGLYLAKFNQIRSPQKRYVSNLLGSYEVSERTRLFMEGTFAYTEATELINQPVYNSLLFGGNSAALTFSATNPLLTAQARSTLQSLGVTSFRLSRASTDLVGDNEAFGESRLFRMVLGAEGDYMLGDREFNWELTANIGRVRGLSRQAFLIQQNFFNAINVTTNAQGTIVCNSAIPGTTADPLCEPLDIFGQGRASPAALDYVVTSATAKDTIKQRVFTFSTGGNVLTLPGGEVGASAGVEVRQERGAFDPDDLFERGLGRSVAIAPVSGKFTTKEAFGELLVPLFGPDQGIPGLHKLTIEGKYRYVDNTINGAARAWTTGLRWAPIEDLELRANRADSIRAPALTELFLPRSELFTTLNDPCDTRFVGGGTRPSVRAANCAQFYQQFGLPGTFTSNAVTATVMGVSGGNSALKNESSESWTAGFIFRPRFAPDFRLAVDWVEIELVDPIVSLTATQLANACFDNDSYPNNFCGSIQRDAAGQVTFIETGFVNGAYVNFSGAQAEAEYKLSLGDKGNLEFRLTGFMLNDLEFNDTGIAPNFNSRELGNSKWQGNLQTSWSYKNFGLSLQALYTGKAVYNRDFNVETRDILELDEQWLFNTAFVYDFNDNARARLVISNITDEQPPFPTNTDTLGIYDWLGRRATISFDYKF